MATYPFLCKECKYKILSKVKFCPECGCSVFIPPDTKIEAEKIFTKVLWIGFIVAGFSGCVYQIGYPYTCQQAKDEHSKAYNARVNREIEGSGLNYLNNLKQAADEMYEKCP